MNTKHNTILKARQFAIKSHNDVNQLYDGLPYYTHLDEVVKYAKKFEYLLSEEDRTIAICSSWCHDILEDCGVSYNDIKNELGEEVSDVVFLLSNHKGKTKKDRANEEYYNKIKENHIALFVKICDRLGNMSHSLLYNNEKMYNMYKKELPHFKNVLYNGMYDDMWNELENLNIENIMTNNYYPNIEKFDENTIHRIHLPRPIPFAMYNELFNKGIVRKCDLKKNHYYYGVCRNADVALWNGFKFIYVRTKFGVTFNETINHLEDDNGYDLFIPLYIIDYKEVKVKDKIKY